MIVNLHENKQSPWLLKLLIIVIVQQLLTPTIYSETLLNLTPSVPDSHLN